MNTEHHAGLEERPAASGAVDERVLARSLAGATMLQIMPALNDEASVRAALNISAALLRAGARSLVASGGGPLVGQLNAQGSEWIDFPNAHVNRWNLSRAVHTLEDIINTERVDIVHAMSPGGAASALAVRERMPLRVVTSLTQATARRAWFDNRTIEALGRGERVIVHSGFFAAPLIKQYNVPRDRIVVIPPATDTSKLDPAGVRAEQIAGIRSAWRVRPGERVFLAAGRVSPSAGHLNLVDAVRVLVNGGLH